MTVIFSVERNPFMRAFGKRELLRGVAVFIDSGDKSMIKPCAKYGVWLVELAAGKIRFIRSRSNDDAVNLHRRA
jgi:hypothetical protein